MGQEAESGAANPLPAATSFRLGGVATGTRRPSKQSQQSSSSSRSSSKVMLVSPTDAAKRIVGVTENNKTGAKGGEYSRVSTLVGILVDGCVRMGGRCATRGPPGWQSIVKKDWVPLGPPYFLCPSSVRPLSLRLTLAAPVHPVTDILQRASSGARPRWESNLQRPFSVKQGRAIGSACRNPARSLVDPRCH